MSSTTPQYPISFDAQFRCTPDCAAWTLVCETGPDFGTIFTLHAGDNYLGRAIQATACVKDLLVSRHHARIGCYTSAHVSGMTECHVEDLGSRNGTFVNGLPVEGVQRIQLSDKIQIGNTILRVGMSLAPAAENTSEITADTASQSIDPFETPAHALKSISAANLQDYVNELLCLTLTQAKASGITFSVLYVDVDDLKAVNHVHGRAAGDQALAHLRSLLLTCCGNLQALYRYDADEFVVVLSRTDGLAAYEIAEKMRAAIESNPLKYNGDTVHLTVSIGGTEMKLTDSPESLLKTVKLNALDARRKGGNRVVYL